MFEFYCFYFPIFYFILRFVCWSRQKVFETFVYYKLFVCFLLSIHVDSVATPMFYFITVFVFVVCCLLVFSTSAAACTLVGSLSLWWWGHRKQSDKKKTKCFNFILLNIFQVIITFQGRVASAAKSQPCRIVRRVFNINIQ